MNDITSAVSIPIASPTTHEEHKKRCLNLEFGKHSGTIVTTADNSQSYYSNLELWHCDDCKTDYVVDWYLENPTLQWKEIL